MTDEKEPNPTTVEEFENMQVVKASDLGMITGRPTFNGVYDVARAVRMNLAGYEDRREPTYGYLHLALNTAALPGGVAVALSADQGLPIPWAAGLSSRQRQNYLNVYNQNQEYFLSDRNAQTCMKNFIIKCIPEVHFKSLKHDFAGYRNVTLRQFLAIMSNDFPATPEEKQVIVQALAEKWDTSEDIVELFDRIKQLLEKQAAMLGRPTYAAEDFIQHTYIAIKETGQMNKYCMRWNKKPLIQRNTEALCRAYFKEKYEEFDAERESLHDVGVANQAVEELEGGLQVVQNENSELRAMFLAQQEEIQSLKTALAASSSTITTPTTVTTNDNNSIVSQLTTVMKQQTDALEKKMLTKLKQGGRQGGRQRTGKRRVKSDGPRDKTKVEKYYDKSDTTCYTCGYDLSDGHDSKTCKRKCEGHDDNHTGDNPVKGHNPKDMEFSKWKNNPRNKQLAGKKEDFE